MRGFQSAFATPECSEGYLVQSQLCLEDLAERYGESARKAAEPSSLDATVAAPGALVKTVSPDASAIRVDAYGARAL